MSDPIPLDDLPRDIEALHALHDELGERIDALCDKRAAVSRRIAGIQSGVDEWTAYRDCISGTIMRSRA